MQKILRKRILRDLRRNLFRYAALGLLIIVSLYMVMNVVGTAQTLTWGTEELAEQTSLEDGEFSVFVPLTEAQREAVADMGVVLEPQFYYDVTLDNEDESTVRIFQVRQQINQIYLTEGSLPETDGQLVVEKRFSEVHGIPVGATVTIGKNDYDVTGIGVVSDYDAPYKSIADTSVNSRSFGMVFVTEGGYRRFAESGDAEMSETYTYAFRLDGTASADELKDYLTDIEISSGQVDDDFFQEYWDRTGGVEEQLKRAVTDLRDGTREMADALKKLDKSGSGINRVTQKLFEHFLEQVNDSLKEAGFSSVLTEKNYKGELTKLIDEAANVFVKWSLEDALDQLEVLKSYKDGLAEYTDAVGELYEGSREMADGVEEFEADVEDAAEEMNVSLSNLTEFLMRSDNPRIYATKNDKLVDIEVGYLAGVIVVILFAYVLSVFVVHAIERESSIIGTLYALGVTRRDLLRHYVTLPFLVTFAASVVGTLIGATGVGSILTAQSSYEYFSIPVFKFTAGWGLISYGIFLPPVLSIVVNVLVINKKLNRTALSLIRNEKKQSRIRKVDLGNIGFVNAFRIRQILRELRSSLAVVMGMFICLLLMMLSLDCCVMCNHIAQNYAEDIRYEYQYTLKYPMEEPPENSQEAYLYGCRKESLGYTFDVTLAGIHKDNPYFDARIEPGKKEVVVSSAFAEKFHIGVGDDFILEDEDNERKLAFTVKTITAYSPSFYVFMDIDSLRDMMGMPDNYYNALFSDEALDIPAGRLYATTTRADIVKGSKVFAELMMPMVTVLTVLSAVIFCVVMYLMMKVMIDRSALNISLVKVFGYRRKEIRRLYLDGNFLVIAVGALVCIPLAKAAMDAAYPLMVSNVACGIDIRTPFGYFVVIYVVIILLYLLINGLLVRRLDDLSVAEVLKNRE